VPDVIGTGLVIAYVALLAVVATFLQAWLPIQEKGDALGDYRAASYLRAEVGFWHPIRRWRREREVRRLLRADPALHRQVRRIGIELWSWEALCLAAALVALDTFIR
jgi:hypothetical protein